MDCEAGALVGRRLECVLTWVVAARWKFKAGGRREFKGGAGGCWEGVSDWVEGERTGEGECSDYIRRSNESVSSGIRIVAACKVAVVRSND